MSALGRLGKLSDRTLYIIILLSILIPVVYPLGLPMAISPMTQHAYDVINALPNGSVVVLQNSDPANYWPQIRPQWVALLHLLFSKDIKIIAYSLYPDASTVNIKIFSTGIAEQYGKKYGEDYVLFGYLPGEETAINAFATNIRKVYSADIYGTPIDNIPLMKNVHDYNDISMVFIELQSVTDWHFNVRQWYGNFKRTLICMSITSEMLGYLGAGKQVEAAIDSLRGGTELEMILHKPGEGVTLIDSRNLGAATTVTLIILGNVGYYFSRKKEAKT